MPVDPRHWPEATAYFARFATASSDRDADKAFLYSTDQLRESDDGSKLYVGRAGVDGIEFVIRRGETGIWAWYPIEGELVEIADNIDEFFEGWTSGAIKV